MKTYILPNNLKKELRKTWGVPIFGKKKAVVKKIQQIFKKKKFKKVITVGDFCSLSIPSDVKIFDGKTKRIKVYPPPKFDGKVLNCKNPAGTIQKETWEIIKKAIKNRENVFVDGEEDLLVIPCVLLSEERTAVIYGMVDKGICLIEVSLEVKKNFRDLLKKF